MSRHLRSGIRSASHIIDVSTAMYAFCVLSLVLCFEFLCFMEIFMAYSRTAMHLRKLQKLGTKQFFHDTQAEAIATTEKKNFS